MYVTTYSSDVDADASLSEVGCDLIFSQHFPEYTKVPTVSSVDVKLLSMNEFPMDVSIHPQSHCQPITHPLVRFSLF